MVHGYHVYQDSWDAAIREQLPCKREPGNLKSFVTSLLANKIEAEGTSLESRTPWIRQFHIQVHLETSVESHLDLWMKCQVHLMCMQSHPLLGASYWNKFAGLIFVVRDESMKTIKTCENYAPWKIWHYVVFTHIKPLALFRSCTLVTSTIYTCKHYNNQKSLHYLNSLDVRNTVSGNTLLSGNYFPSRGVPAWHLFHSLSSHLLLHQFLWLMSSGNCTPGSRSYSDLVDDGQTLFAPTSSYSSLSTQGCLIKSVWLVYGSFQLMHVTWWPYCPQVEWGMVARRKTVLTHKHQCTTVIMAV